METPSVAALKRRLKTAVQATSRELDTARQRVTGGPVPPRSIRRQVSGNFFGVGREFFSYMVDLGGLRPTDRILDIGCKAGRMAIPLAAYLKPEARYDGVDDWKDGIEWCRRTLSPRYPNLTFQRVPIEGRTGALEPLPFDDGSSDFCFFASINHLTPEQFAFTLHEVGRLLAPEGTYLGTWYLRDRLGNRPPGTPGPGACSETEAKERLASEGLVADGVYRGSWDGFPSPLTFQDVVVARKRAPGGTDQ
jgi:SAM-dependent methyltransferase